MSQDKVCMETREEFSALLDEELTPEERERVEAHLSECSECLRELNALKRVDDAYGALPEVVAPKGFEKRVRGVARPRRRIRPIIWMGPVLAVAAAVLVVISGVFERDAVAPVPFQTAYQNVEADADGQGTLLKREVAKSTAAAEREAMSDEQVSRLRSLGYLSDEESERLESLGYLEDESELREMSSRPDEPLSLGAASANRRAVLGEPMDRESSTMDDSLKKKASSSRSARVSADLFAVPIEDRDQLVEQEVPVSRMSLRSFNIRDDGVWIESSYAGEQTVALKRGSRELANLLVLDPEVKKIVNRPDACIFLVRGRWYRLESAPEADDTP